jgi:hypothetical protein
VQPIVRDAEIAGCRFPLWPHGAKPDHRYCGREQRPGSAYCQPHHARCFDAIGYRLPAAGTNLVDEIPEVA